VQQQRNGGGSDARAGAVPGRPVLDVPGWQDTHLARSTMMGLQSAAPSVPQRLRIFSGTSNQVGGWGVRLERGLFQPF